jgi:hypothetical protein
MTIILTLRRLRQEDHEFKASLGSQQDPATKKLKKKKKKKNCPQLSTLVTDGNVLHKAFTYFKRLYIK